MIIYPSTSFPWNEAHRESPPLFCSSTRSKANDDDDRLWKAATKRQLPPVASTEEAADMYDMTVEEAAAHGFSHYEVASYARTRQAMSKHNFSYWQGMDYLGKLWANKLQTLFQLGAHVYCIYCTTTNTLLY